MKTAFISDIHGNVPALQAVLADIESQHVDQIICLGDVALFGPRPRAAVQLLQSLNCPVVLGNTDEWALDPHPYPYRDERTYYINTIEAWGAEQLSAAELAFIGSFQATVTATLGEGLEALCAHATPRSNTELLFPHTPENEVLEMLAGCDAAVVAVGHTHAQFLRPVEAWQLFNPGSVGLPIVKAPDGRIMYQSAAHYAIVTAAGGQLRFDFRRVAYDVAQTWADAAVMPEGEWWCQQWLQFK